MQTLALSLVAFAQGVPFFHAGDEILRSKSGDGDSYDSGDLFNAIDFSYETNNWGIGLPPAWRNKNEWPFWEKRLTNNHLKVSQEQILTNLANFHRILKIRKSSKLFRLDTFNDIRERVSFLENETFNNNEVITAPIEGLISMYISDKNFLNKLDKEKNGVLTIFNTANKDMVFRNSLLKTLNLELCPFLLENITLKVNNKEVTIPYDSRITKAIFNKELGEIVIPARTTLVYFEKI